jgi:dephospho-CoA kinase
MGSGKSTFVKKLKETVKHSVEVFVIDADNFARGVLIDKYGKKLASMSKKAFDDVKSLREYNAKVHPFIINELADFIRYHSYYNVIIVDGAILPVYSTVSLWFDKKYWLSVPRDVRLERMTQKEVVPPNYEDRVYIQEALMPIDKFCREWDDWNFIIEEDLDLIKEDIERYLESVHQKQDMEHKQALEDIKKLQKME